MNTHSFENILYEYQYPSTSQRVSDAVNRDYFDFQRRLTSSYSEPGEKPGLVRQIAARLFCLVFILSLFYLVSLVI